MAKSVCKDCNMTVVMATVRGELVATDPELITVITARQTGPSPASDQSSIQMNTSKSFARRVHAERCQDYQERAKKERLLAEQREYTRKHGRTPRNHGL